MLVAVPSLCEALIDPCTTPGTPALMLPPTELEALWEADWLAESLAPCDQLLDWPADQLLESPWD